MRPNSVILTGLLIVGLWASTSTSAEPVVVRTQVIPAEVWVGQRAILQIQVLGRDGWATIKHLGDIDVPGIQVLHTESQGIRLQETISGTNYIGQEYTLNLYPHRAGTITLPEFQQEVTVKTWGAQPPETTQIVTIPATSFHVKRPPGTTDIKYLVSTSNLTAVQTWTPETQEARVGDALKRSVRLEAVEVSGMAFAPLPASDIEGLKAYRREPVVKDQLNRGSLRGQREETVTYICERAGSFEIPELVIPWWDIEAQALKRIKLPGLALNVTGPVPDKAASSSATYGHPSPWIWITIVAAGALVWLGLHYQETWTTRYRQWQGVRQNSEVAHYRRLRRAIRAEDPRAVVRELMHWLDCLQLDDKPARLDAFLERFSDGQLRGVTAQLLTSLVVPHTHCDYKALSRGLLEARGRWQRRGRATQKANQILPPFNAPAVGT